MLQSFSVFNASYNSGVRVACMDLNGDDRADILISGGLGSLSEAYGYNGLSLAGIRTFSAFDPSFTGGIYVG